MKFGLSWLLLAVTVVAESARYRSGFDCRRRCSYDPSPVCSADGVTYENECMLQCDRAYKACDGVCPCYGGYPRPDGYYRSRFDGYYHSRPGVYYDSGPMFDYQGSRGDCKCSPDKDYVCTDSGETYDNACEAQCDGRFVVCDGRCPCTSY